MPSMSMFLKLHVSMRCLTLLFKLFNRDLANLSELKTSVSHYPIWKKNVLIEAVAVSITTLNNVTSSMYIALLNGSFIQPQFNTVSQKAFFFSHARYVPTRRLCPGRLSNFPIAKSVYAEVKYIWNFHKELIEAQQI